ncbi:retrovirus-related pol polyprotein from transposon TNT 1-94, partial [Tanacetum coccineum]
MLKKHLYDSWKSRMELYMQNREHGRMIFESVEHGPLIWPTIKENGVSKTKKYKELTATEKIQADYDLKATNIILQGLPADVYSLVNHQRVANDLWERIQLLMGSLHQYYLRFTQLVNYMNIYKMKLEQFQVNTKFLNSLPPEGSKFVTDVKLVKDLHTTNFDQLHAYLEQHELHANEVRIMHERNQDPLVLLRNSSNPRQQANIHDERVTVQPVQRRQSLFATGTSGTRANISGISGNNSGQQRVVKCFNYQGEAQGSGKVLNEEELEFLADLGVAEGPVTQTTITYNAAYQANHLDAYDSDCDDFFTAKVVLMANLSSYGSDVLSKDTNSIAQQDAMILSVFEQLSNQVTNCNKVNKDNLIANESLSFELERYKERVKLLEERQNVDLSTREKLIMDGIIREKNAQFMDFEKEINYLKQTLSEQSKEKDLLTKTFNVFKNESKEKEAKNIDKEIALENKVKELDNSVCKMGQSAQIVHMLTKPQVFYENNLKQALGFQNPFYLKKAQQIRPMLYDGSVIAKVTNVISIVDSKETLMLEEESQSKMLLKQSDPMVLEKKVNIKPINYVELNRLSEDFDIVNIVVNSSLDINTSVNVNSSAAMNDSVNYVEMCNKCLELEAELIKQHNMNDTSVNQTKPTFDHLFELDNLKAELQAKDTTIEKLKANIKRLNKTSTTNSVKKDIDEIETINIELEHRVAKLIAKNEHLKQTYKQLYDSIKPSRVRSKEHAESLVNQLNQKSVEITDLNAQLQEKVFVITTLKNDLRKFKGKDIVDNAAQVSNATTIAPGMYKLDPVTLAPKDKNNRETHIYYLKHTMEQAAILREIVEQAKSLNPLDSASYSACKYVKLIQELLGYVRDTCPDIHKPSEKLVAVTPINKKKIVSSMFDARHELCFLEFVSDMNASSKSKSVKKAKKKEEWKPTGKVFTKIGYNWRPTGRTFTLVGNVCPLTRITATNKVPLREPIPLKIVRNKSSLYLILPTVVQIVLWYLDSGCSKHMIGDRSQLTNFVYKFLGTVKFGNDQIAKIMRYGDYQLGNITISRVYYVEGLGHNLFSIGQFCNSDLEVAFRKHTCFVRNLEGVNLFSGSRETNLYTLSIRDMMSSSLICLLSKSLKTKSWLWHRRLSHLNFGAINYLAKNGLVQGEVIKAKSSIEEPPELELKDLPSHLEYAYLEGNDKLPVIIAKGLKDVEKEALLK